MAKIVSPIILIHLSLSMSPVCKNSAEREHGVRRAREGEMVECADVPSRQEASQG